MAEAKAMAKAEAEIEAKANKANRLYQWPVL